jgi:hypothetical protein
MSEQHHDSMGIEGKGARTSPVVKERERETLALAAEKWRRRDCD